MATTDISLVNNVVEITPEGGSGRVYYLYPASYAFNERDELQLSINGSGYVIPLADLRINGAGSAPASTAAALTSLSSVFPEWSVVTPTLAQVLAESSDADEGTINNLANPVSDQQAATKKYVDDNAGGGLDINGLSAAAALDGTEEVPVYQAGGNKKTTTQDIADLGGGGATTIYTGDGVLSGNRTIDLDGNSLVIQQSGQTYFSLAPTAGSESVFFQASNFTDDGNTSVMSASTTDTSASLFFNANFNDGAKTAEVYAFADATTSTITHTADTHTFNGEHINLANLRDFATNADAISGGLNPGDQYYTRTVDEAVMKIVVTPS